jgi:3-isopropylmalate dehydrogenase
MRAALHVLAALRPLLAVPLDVEKGGPIGLHSTAQCGKALSEDVVTFCRKVFNAGGAVLCGPAGGRFVYDLRRWFDLYYKVSPVKPYPELVQASRLRARFLRGVDILIVRDNSGGIYQGSWHETVDSASGRVAKHSFSYSEIQVRRIAEAGARLARQRRGRITVVVKDDGIPSVSRLWRDIATELVGNHGLTCSFLNVDHAAYRLVQHAQEFDVVITPNLFGDILADLGAVLLGSRGLTFSGNFGDEGQAVYQTNHGSAHDIAGTDRANPVGQIYSLAMLLRESFGLYREAGLIEDAVVEAWREGWRTADLAASCCRLVGTQELADRIAEAVARLGAQETVQ